MIAFEKSGYVVSFFRGPSETIKNRDFTEEKERDFQIYCKETIENRDLAWKKT